MFEDTPPTPIAITGLRYPCTETTNLTIKQNKDPLETERRKERQKKRTLSRVRRGSDVTSPS